MSRTATIGALLALGIFESAYLSAELRAPLSGLAIAAIGVALVAVGYVAGPTGMLLAAAGAAAPLVVWYLTGDEGVPGPTENCDPSCGISLSGALIIALPIAVALAGIGVAIRALTRRFTAGEHALRGRQSGPK